MVNLANKHPRECCHVRMNQRDKAIRPHLCVLDVLLHSVFKMCVGARQTVKWVRVLDTKPDGFSSIHEIHVGERTN